MGFKPQRTLYKLKFTDDKYDGMEIVVRSVPIGTLAKLQSEGEKNQNSINELCELLSSNIQSWNLEFHDGSPMPITLDSLLDQEFDFVYDVVNAWTSAITGVTDELKKDLKNGGNTEELNLPMVPLPMSPVS
ncbi:MAG TPA: hypothetical protein VLT90_12925 [Terriglobales bacterium]|nr:hypothetical protein [Terriglobales bacterium]